MNATLLSRGNAGRAMVGLQFGNFEKPREFAALKYRFPSISRVSAMKC